jgi:hypothetical protein
MVRMVNRIIPTPNSEQSIRFRGQNNFPNTKQQIELRIPSVSEFKTEDTTYEYDFRLPRIR